MFLLITFLPNSEQEDSISHHFIEFKNVCYTYPDKSKALNDISFRIEHGESVGIIGANGAGKSTLLMCIVGILFPEKGEIQVGGIPVTKKTLADIRRHIGFTFQNPDDQLFMNTVYEDVAFGPRNYNLDEKVVESSVLKALDILGITHLKDKPPYRLSGGEKREAAIASVLSLEPDILLMDEPSSGLDPGARRRLITFINTFSHTKLITSHDLDLIMDTCSRIIILHNGSITHDGTPVKILNDGELLHSWGLEKPLRLQACPVCGNKAM